ncbi:MAG: PIN domain-containing protein [Acidobacteria bacterium]|nr:PIN domain-containing protein [Acidobacteriota bacterium]
MRQDRLRIGTNPRTQRALPLSAAVSAIGGWFAQPLVSVLQPGERHWSILNSLLTSGQARGPLLMDAHLAALAIEHGATLCTHDKDFARFPGLRTFDPLES